MQIENISDLKRYAIYFIGRFIKGSDTLDKLYLQMLYKHEMGEKINFDKPLTFNEKLQWLKIYNKNPIYTQLVDKFEVKKIIAQKFGDKCVIPTYGIWSAFNDIDFDKLPNRFVLKCTHDSGSVVIVKDKSKLDFHKTKEVLSHSLKRNYYDNTREWPYKNVKPRIIAEKYIIDENNELNDYKFYCFNGYVDCVMACYERSSGNPKFYFFDNEWKLKRINVRGKYAPEDFSKPKPVRLDEMFYIAQELSKGIPFVRVDLYEVSGKVYFGEMTFCPQSGLDPNYLPETDKYFGKLIDLSLSYQYNKYKCI